VQPLTLTPLPNLPLIQPGDNLAGLILDSAQQANLRLQEGDILVVTSKIISKAEGRRVRLAEVQPSPAAQELAQKSGKDPRLCQLILQESREILRVRPGSVIVEHRLGFVCANAGIDQSNLGEGEEAVLLLPQDPNLSASRLRAALQEQSGVRLGILLIDSHGRAWRIGTVGTSIGISGIPAILDERGWQDLFGYTLKITIVGVADELAAAASLLMGQAAEGAPVVHVRGFPYPLTEGDFSQLLRPKEQDMFR
jgi:coenzyme F420-0:L-glutamate ligase/coenzyme F420-1:gamma-L-glutamate ligase